MFINWHNCVMEYTALLYTVYKSSVFRGQFCFLSIHFPFQMEPHLIKFRRLSLNNTESHFISFLESMTLQYCIVDVSSKVVTQRLC